MEMGRTVFMDMAIMPTAVIGQFQKIESAAMKVRVLIHSKRPNTGLFKKI